MKVKARMMMSKCKNCANYKPVTVSVPKFRNGTMVWWSGEHKNGKDYPDVRYINCICSSKDFPYVMDKQLYVSESELRGVGDEIYYGNDKYIINGIEGNKVWLRDKMLSVKPDKLSTKPIGVLMMTDYKDNPWQCDKCADKDKQIAELKAKLTAAEADAADQMIRNAHILTDSETVREERDREKHRADVAERTLEEIIVKDLSKDAWKDYLKYRAEAELEAEKGTDDGLEA